jgi:quinol monooxygenase YgiN
MYGLIGKLKAIHGQRDALAMILLDGVAGMPGCLSYVVATDPTDGDAIWITEVWDSRELHQASLTLPAVQEAIAQGRPLIAEFGERFETTPIGGRGLQDSTRPVSHPEEM